MHAFPEHKKIIIGVSLFMFTVVAGASWYVHEVQSDYVLNTRLKISEQETTLATIATVTDRDGADEVVEKIIKDCSIENRERFDMLLGELAQLRGQELVEVQQLFNACGNFFAQRKAVMTARLQREYEVYKDFIEILSLVEKKADLVSYNVEQWGVLVDLETKQSELSTKLVDIQGEIIRALRQNTPIESDTLQLLLVDGQKTKDSLYEISARIDVVRGEILNI